MCSDRRHPPRKSRKPPRRAPAQTKAPATTAKKEAELAKPRLAVFRLAGPVQETPREEVFNFGGDTGVPLATLVSRLDKAAKDSSVKAVVILLEQTDRRLRPGRGVAAGDLPAARRPARR